MAWRGKQARIEKRLYDGDVKHHGEPPAIVLYDVTSSYFEGEHNELADYGYNRDGKKGKKQVEPLMRGGRARGKVENETFNTLKNQGHCLEHHYGHGQQHLATVLALLMRLAFLVDQVQELDCRLFQAARAHFRSRTSLGERLRALFTGYTIPHGKALWEAIATGHLPSVLAPDTS